MVTLKENGSIYSMNPAAKQMFGYRENEFFGDDFAQLVPQIFRSGRRCSPVACDWAHLAGCTGGTVLALARTRGRATFPVEISLSETVADEGKYYVAMIRDITSGSASRKNCPRKRKPCRHSLDRRRRDHDRS